MADNFNISDVEPASTSLAGVKRAVMIGANNDVDIGTIPEDIWRGADVIPQPEYVFPLVAETLSIVSSVASDGVAGTGALTVVIIGLDASFAVVSETVIMNGLTPVISANAYYRVNNFFVGTAGASFRNDGDITATQTTSAIVVSVLGALDGSARQAVWTVPDTWTAGALVNNGILSAGKQSASEADVALLFRPNGGAFITGTTVALNPQGTGSFSFNIALSATFLIGTDFLGRCESLSANTTGLTMLINFVEVT